MNMYSCAFTQTHHLRYFALDHCCDCLSKIFDKVLKYPSSDRLCACDTKWQRRGTQRHDGIHTEIKGDLCEIDIRSEREGRRWQTRRGGGAHTYTSTLLARRLPACIIFTLRLIHFLPGCHSQRDYPSVNFVCHLPAVTHSVITVGVLLACGCEGHNDIVRVQIW